MCRGSTDCLFAINSFPITLGGYWVAILLEARVLSWCETAFEFQWGHWKRTVAEGAVFLWILEVATEFQHVVWITGVLASLWQ